VLSNEIPVHQKSLRRYGFEVSRFDFVDGDVKSLLEQVLPMVHSLLSALIYVAFLEGSEPLLGAAGVWVS
jgi:hypothetical protein